MGNESAQYHNRSDELCDECERCGSLKHIIDELKDAGVLEEPVEEFFEYTGVDD